MRRSTRRFLGCSLLVGAAACGGAPSETTDGSNQDFSSALATLLDMSFDGEVTTSQATNLTGTIRAQLLFTVGHFNAEPGVARLGKVALTNVTSTAIGGGLTRVRYHAVLPVAWGHKTGLPTSYTLTLPHRIDGAGQTAFMQKYSASCNDGEGASIMLTNYWYHYRPHASGCALDAADVTTTTAAVTVNRGNTTGRYPEYHKVWEDGALKVVAVFGKYAKLATDPYDPGISAYNEFVDTARATLGDPTTVPANLPPSPGVAAPDVTLEKTFPDGRSVAITAILVDEVQSAPATFDKRYAELTPGADVILYDGHAGLGANVRALATKGQFFPGQYQLFFMNGCDTFAYQDDTLTRTRAALNPDDPTGTKYMDFVTNGMPAYFSSLTPDSMAIVNALLAKDTPHTYEQIFANVDSAQVVTVVGEEDNVFAPGRAMPAPVFTLPGGVVTHAAVQSFQTPVLEPGTYEVTMTADPGYPGADADMRARAGVAPDSAAYKCQSYKYNSNERCFITVPTREAIFMTVSGYSAAAARYEVRVFGK